MLSFLKAVLRFTPAFAKGLRAVVRLLPYAHLLGSCSKSQREAIGGGVGWMPDVSIKEVHGAVKCLCDTGLMDGLIGNEAARSHFQVKCLQGDFEQALGALLLGCALT